MKLSEPRDKATLDETDIEEWTGLELLTFEWNEPLWILRDLPPVVIRTRKSIITLLTKEFAQLEADRDEYRNLYHLGEAKIMSREAIIESLSETELAKDVTRLEAKNEALQAELGRVVVAIRKGLTDKPSLEKLDAHIIELLKSQGYFDDVKTVLVFKGEEHELKG